MINLLNNKTPFSQSKLNVSVVHCWFTAKRRDMWNGTVAYSIVYADESSLFKITKRKKKSLHLSKDYCEALAEKCEWFRGFNRGKIFTFQGGLQGQENDEIRLTLRPLQTG